LRARVRALAPARARERGLLPVRRPRPCTIFEVAVGELLCLAGRQIDDEQMRPRVERVAVAIRLVLSLRDVARPLFPPRSRTCILRAWLEPDPRVEGDLRAVRRPARRPGLSRHPGQPPPLRPSRRHRTELARPPR